jgi:hypothetical protein
MARLILQHPVEIQQQQQQQQKLTIISNALARSQALKHLFISTCERRQVGFTQEKERENRKELLSYFYTVTIRHTCILRSITFEMSW